jgi:hypothetical protein
MKMTARQKAILDQLSKSDGSAYSLGTSLTIIEALSRRGFVCPVGHGHYAFPRSGMWRITKNGRAALEQ